MLSSAGVFSPKKAPHCQYSFSLLLVTIILPGAVEEDFEANSGLKHLNLQPFVSFFL